MTIASYLYDKLTSNEETLPTGADAIRTAVNEYQDITEREFTATLGEPDLLPRGGTFFNDPKVIVPVRDGPFNEEQRLIFDLPANGETAELFNEFLSLVGVDFDTMENVAGTEVPVNFVSGNLIVDWNQITPPENTEKGAAEDDEETLTEEEIDEIIEEGPETVEEIEEEDYEDGADSVSESVVQSEEKTISAEGDD